MRNDDQRGEEISGCQRQQRARAGDRKLRVEQDRGDQIADEHDGVERGKECVELDHRLAGDRNDRDESHEHDRGDGKRPPRLPHARRQIEPRVHAVGFVLRHAPKASAPAMTLRQSGAVAEVTAAIRCGPPGARRRLSALGNMRPVARRSSRRRESAEGDSEKENQCEESRCHRARARQTARHGCPLP